MYEVIILNVPRTKLGDLISRIWNVDNALVAPPLIVWIRRS